MNLKHTFISIYLLTTIFPSAAAISDSTGRKAAADINIDFCSSINSHFSDGSHEKTFFKINRVRLDIRGKASDKIAFRVRQSFNKSFTKDNTDNVPGALEYANIQWRISDNFKLTAGKQFLALGGYEALANSMYVREFSDFNNGISFYRTGLTGSIFMDKRQDHELQLQVMNNKTPSSPFMASICWNGMFARKSVNLIYAFSAAPSSAGNSVYMFSCGNIYQSGPIFAYLDIMYSREGIDTQNRISILQPDNMPYGTARNVSYLTFIGQFDYAFHPNWNVYVKGAYETADVYSDSENFVKGQYLSTWNAQASVEWFPLGKEENLRVFFHCYHKWYDVRKSANNSIVRLPETQRLSMGLIYVLPVLKS